MKRAIPRDAWAILGLGLLLLVLLHRSVLLGEVFSPAAMLLGNYAPWTHLTRLPGGNPLRGDDVFLFYPMLVTHLGAIFQGNLPLWDATKLAGTPAAWNGVNLGMYGSPFSLILVMLSGSKGSELGWYAFARLLVAGSGMYFFLRTYDLRRLAAWVAAVVFMLNGLMITALSSPTPTIWAWLPWSLLAIEKLARGAGKRWIAWFGLFMGFQFLGAYVAHSFIYVVVVGAYGLWRAATVASVDLKKSFLLLGQMLLGGIGGCLVGAVGLFPMLESMSHSSMAGRLAGIGFFPTPNLLTYLAPNLYGNPALGSTWGWYGNYVENIAYFGILSLFLAGYGLWSRGRSFAWFWVGLVLVILLYQYGAPIFSQLGYLPGFRQMVPSRWHAALVTGMAILAGWGLDALLSERRAIGKSWILFVGATALAIFLGLKSMLPMIREAHAQPFIRDAFWFWIGSVVLATPVIFFMATKKLEGRKAGLILSGLVVLDLMAFAMPFNPTTPKSAFYPETPGLRFLVEHRKEGRILPFDHVLLGETPGLYGLESVTGYDVFGDQELRDLLTRSGNRTVTPEQAVTLNDYVEVTTSTGSASVNELRFNVNPHSPILDLLGVKYFVHSPNAPDPTSKTPLVYRGPDLKIAENPDARPRAWFAAEARYLPSRAAVLDALSQAPSGGPREVLLEGTSTAPASASAQGTVSILSWTSDHKRLQTDSNGPGYLVLSERTHPSWTARIDDKPVPLLAADGFLQAIALPSGKHTVSVDFEPKLVRASLASTYVTLFLLLGIALWPRRRLTA